MERDDDNNNLTTEQSNFQIQSIFNAIRIKLYAMLIYYKKLIVYYDKINNSYNQNQLESIPVINKCIFNKVPLYVLKDDRLLEKLHSTVTLPENTIVILCRSYHKLVVIKMTIETLLNYRIELRKYIKYIHDKISCVIDAQNSLRQLYGYIINGMNYDNEYQKLIDDHLKVDNFYYY